MLGLSWLYSDQYILYSSKKVKVEVYSLVPSAKHYSPNFTQLPQGAYSMAAISSAQRLILTCKLSPSYQVPTYSQVERVHLWAKCLAMFDVSGTWFYRYITVTWGFCSACSCILTPCIWKEKGREKEIVTDGVDQNCLTSSLKHDEGQTCNAPADLCFLAQVDVAKHAYHQEDMLDDDDDDDDDDEKINPRDVGHNIYILAHQVGHNINIVVHHVGHNINNLAHQILLMIHLLFPSRNSVTVLSAWISPVSHSDNYEASSYGSITLAPSNVGKA